MMVDVAIIGAGPAGLSAALTLARCRRDVVVFDSGRPRNAASLGLHGFLTRDGVTPQELRRLGRADIAKYPGVIFREERVIRVERRAGGSPARFGLRTEAGTGVESRTLLLATGRDDELPQRPGFAELYGRGVYHCPFCDGWEQRDQPLVAYGKSGDAAGVALELLTWSRRVTLCSDGPCEIGPSLRGRLETERIAVREARVVRLRADAERWLAAIEFAGGGALACRALFFVTGCPQKSALPENLGCELDASGGVVCKGHAATGVPGLFVAGNVRGGLHFAIAAAAEGAEAAVAINDALLEAGRRR